MTTKQAVPFLKETYSRWSDHNAPRLGASVAFYSILSFAPLLVLITAIIGLVFGHEGAHGTLVSEARQLMGNHGAETVDSLLKNSDKPASGTLASAIAFITLLLGASGVFIELQDALNIMWDAPKQEYSGVMGMIKQRLFSFGMILCVGFLLLVSLLLSSGLEYVGHGFSHLLPLPPFVLQILNFLVSFIVISGLFALMFKYVPAVHVSWREVIVGAIGTALLFTIGKFLLSIYFAKASVGSTYGAAGSLVAVVVWIYYSAQIFFFGAEFTRVYADEQRGRTAPQPSRQPPAAMARAASPHNDPEPVHLPRTMSAAAGASQSNRTIAVANSQPRSASAAHRVDAMSENAVSRKTKPAFLAALGIGYLLGRMSLKNRKDESHQSD